MTLRDGSDTAHRRRDLLGLVVGGEGAITGTVVCAAAIAYGAGHVKSTGELSLAILGTVAVYWLAHLHAVTLGSSLTHRHHPIAAFRHALVVTAPIFGASIVPLLVLLVSRLAGAELRTSAWIALIATIGLLTLYSYLAGARGGLDTGGRIASACAGAAIGILVALLKVALH
ncbi:hypothetical protein [Nocardioides sp. CER19]|uniref:hypothetical protein n=1 Tax=Nocardioides sp. CER19 TaxID=3038538 RepID=UPI00244C1968|nr:hypothetical protein [Nocardioides sp. CER19]MDH2415552.1 hypothetical protein [Nocardioides sp. CER19]